MFEVGDKVYADYTVGDYCGVYEVIRVNPKTLTLRNKAFPQLVRIPYEALTKMEKA